MGRSKGGYVAEPIFADVEIIDSDTHWSEPHDLWTSLAPAKYKDLVPQIKERNGKRMWVVNGDIPIAGDSAVSAILPDGEKMLGRSREPETHPCALAVYISP